MRSRVTQLSAGFEQCVAAFTQQSLFTGPSLHFHLKTMAIRARYASAVEALRDKEFFEFLYATLTAWGMHRMGRSYAKLADYDEIVASFQRQAGAIGEIESLRLRNLNPTEAQEAGLRLWSIMASLRISTSETQIVASSKALHHLLPSLVPPIDREYTLRFFYNHKTISRGDKATFLEIFPLLRDIAASQGHRLEQLVGSGMNTSETKVINNAIIGFVHTHLR